LGPDNGYIRHDVKIPELKTAFFSAEVTLCEGIRRDDRYAFVDIKSTVSLNIRDSPVKKIITTIAITAFAATSGLAQQRGGVSETCRNEIVELCGMPKERGGNRACIKENIAKISEGCQKELKAMMQSRKARKNAG
jgi:hypothetical protein